MQNSGLNFQEISSDECNSSFSEFSEKSTLNLVSHIQKFSDISYRKFRLHQTFLLEFVELFVQWLAFWKFNYFWNIWVRPVPIVLGNFWGIFGVAVLATTSTFCLSEQLLSNFWHRFRNFLAVSAFYEHNRATPIRWHFSKNLKRGKMARTFSWKVSRKYEKCWIFEKRTFQPKFWKFPLENKTEWKFPVQRFRKFGYTSRGCLISWNSIRHCKSPEVQSRYFHRMESASGNLSTKCPYYLFPFRNFGLIKNTRACNDQLTSFRCPVSWDTVQKTASEKLGKKCRFLLPHFFPIFELAVSRPAPQLTEHLE